MEIYMRLLDTENLDVIVKACGRKSYEYIFGDNPRWKRTGMLEYYNESSDKYEKYEEISPGSALEYLGRQNMELNKIYEYLNNEILKLKHKDKSLFDIMLLNGGFENLETDIVSIFFSLGWDFYQEHRKIINNITRIDNSVKTLFSCCRYENEEKLIRLRIHRNTGVIARKLMDYYFNNNSITAEKYKILSDFFEQKIVMLSEEQKKIIFN
ncbi:MAG: hypothetical protein HDT39_17235 [Lachnospiraceae bacterium]|nr:hypothetical protein [Lachnospiraceae bacterium]